MPLIKIKQIGDKIAASGVFLADGNERGPNGERIPKLTPGKIAEVPEGHSALKLDCVELVSSGKPDIVIAGEAPKKRGRPPKSDG